MTGFKLPSDLNSFYWQENIFPNKTKMTNKFPHVPICLEKPNLDFGNGGIVAFVGKTGSGKTQRLRQILKHNANQFNYIMVMCPKGTMVEYDFMEKDFIKEYSEKLLSKIVKMHEDTFTKSGKYLRAGIIIDDCVAHSPTFMDLAIRARKLGVTIFFLVQHWHTKLTTPLIRDSANYIFMTSALDAECNRMKDSTQNGISKADFAKLCNHYVKGFGHLLFDNRPGSVEKIIYYPPYSIGKFNLKNFST